MFVICCFGLVICCLMLYIVICCYLLYVFVYVMLCYVVCYRHIDVKKWPNSFEFRMDIYL